MEIDTTIINTVLLLALFWYQRNKNKVLADRISEQSGLLKETKDVVTNQAQAIDSQKKVVDTALEYSRCFDLEKIEAIIKRELGLEYEEIIQSQRLKIEKHEKTLEKAPEAIIKEIEHSAGQMAKNFILPLTRELFGFLAMASQEKRERVLSKIPKNISDSLRSFLTEYDKKRPSLLEEAFRSAEGTTKK